MNSASKCRKNKWKVGDTLKGTEVLGDGMLLVTYIQITAIGESNILAKSINSKYDTENTWSLNHRKWRKIK